MPNDHNRLLPIVVITRNYFMKLIDSKEAAQRLARAIAADILLYHEERVNRSLKEDNFFEDMADEISQGRQLYESRVSTEILQATRFFDLAIVDVVIKSFGERVQTPNW